MTMPLRLSAFSVVFGAALLAPIDARADYLVLANGDRLTGTIQSESPAEFVVMTELAGRVLLRRGDVVNVTRTERAAQQTAPGSSSHAWNGVANAGLDISHGNSPSQTVVVNAALTRVGTRDKLGLFGASLYSMTGAGDSATTLVRSVRGGARYDHDVTTRLFGFGFGEIEHDLLQLLDLRTVAGGGGGVHAVRTRSTLLNFTAGASFAHDAYVDLSVAGSSSTPTSPTSSGSSGTTQPGNSGNGPSGSLQGRGLATAPGQNRGRNGTPPAVVRTSLNRNVGEFMVGQDLWQQVNDAISVTQRLGVFPAVGDFADYRVSFDATLGVQITSRLQWNATVADRYLHVPPAGGAVRNDLFVSTGLGVTFGGGGAGTYQGTDGRPREAFRDIRDDQLSK
jgi:putative salt-induced outer membrane protein YdiY